MTRVDFLASEPQFLDHLLPVWDALPRSERGTFRIMARPSFGVPIARMLEQASHRGLSVGEGLDGLSSHVVVASVGDLGRAHRGGGREVALLEHGCGQSFGGDHDSARSSSYPGGSGRDASLFIVPNEHAAGRERAVRPDAAVAVVGCPKLDDRPDPAPRDDRPVVAVSFHWDCTVCPETRSGWREFRGAAAALAQSGRYRVLGHGHPRILSDLAPHYRALGIEVVRDFAEVQRRANVYVNEGSSTLFEAAATGIPVVVLNPSFFRTSIRHGLRFWDAAHVGVQVRSHGTYDSSLPKRVLRAVDEALEDAPERRSARNDALAIVYARLSGAASAAADAIGRWASSSTLVEVA